MRIVPLVAFVLLASNGAARAADLRQRLLNNERRLWAAWQAHDPVPFRRSLTQDTTQIVTGIGAIEGREAVAKSMASHSCTLAGFRLSNGSLRMLGGAVAMLSYSARQSGRCGKTPLPPKLQVTAIYVREGQLWRAASYQETPVN